MENRKRRNEKTMTEEAKELRRQAMKKYKETHKEEMKAYLWLATKKMQSGFT